MGTQYLIISFTRSFGSRFLFSEISACFGFEPINNEVVAKRSPGLFMPSYAFHFNLGKRFTYKIFATVNEFEQRFHFDKFVIFLG